MDMKKTNFIFGGLLLSMLHAGLTFLFYYLSFGTCMGHSDQYEPLPNCIGELLLYAILSFPGDFIYQTWLSRTTPHVVKWTVLFTNSLFWGFGIFVILNSLRKILPQRSQRKLQNKNL